MEVVAGRGEGGYVTHLHFKISSLHFKMPSRLSLFQPPPISDHSCARWLIVVVVVFPH